MAEVVVIYAVVVFYAVRGIEPYRHGHPSVAFACKVGVIKAVVSAMHHHPEVRLIPLGIVEAIDHHLGHASVIRQMLLGAAKGDDIIGRRVAIAEHQSRHHQVFTSDPQVGTSGDEDLALGLGGQGDGAVGQAIAPEDDLEVTPFAVGKDDRVARL